MERITLKRTRGHGPLPSEIKLYRRQASVEEEGEGSHSCRLGREIDVITIKYLNKLR